MSEIKIEKISEEQLKELGVYAWPIWQKEASVFDWHYDSAEECYILSGKVRVEPDGGEPVEFGTGDFVSFPAGMDCTWEILEDVRKHYNFK
jgi:uncharacterized cupin superfamily protein